MIYFEVLSFLIVILVAALIFTNALEHLGARLGISEGVTGSIFAAVGTALPETMIPLLALFAGGGASTETAEAIGVGAILGAPLLLSTLAMFLMMLAVVGRRKFAGEMRPERSGLTRDLDFFLIAYALAAAALFVPPNLAWLRTAIGALLVLLYCAYLVATIRASSELVEAGHETEAPGRMYAARLGLPTNLASIGLQVLIGIVLLIVGAEGFIHSIDAISQRFGIPALLLSLIIAPIATELPEKVNSILWVRRDRDTLAFGNVTGAMVFQGSLLPALGIFATPWSAEITVIASVAATLIAAAWLRVLLIRGQLKVWHLAVNGVLYGGYLATVLSVG
ncbi:MAG TPA: sodium:calcium antiporter [Gammaproteobacteria bacterium]|nr:sodium:calcium antiporter [Gammaproteobacteria bacterium]